MLLELATAALIAALGRTPPAVQDEGLRARATAQEDAQAQEGAPARDERPPAVSEVPS